MGYRLVPGTYIAVKLKCESEDVVYDERERRSLNVDDPACLIHIFQRQIISRHLDPAQAIIKKAKKNKASMYPAMMILTPIFELLGNLLSEPGADFSNRQAWDNGFLKVFPETDFDGVNVFNELRCGLFHEAIARRCVLTKRIAMPIEVRPEEFENVHVALNPQRIERGLRKFINTYCNSLRDFASEEGESVELQRFTAFYGPKIGLQLQK